LQRLRFRDIIGKRVIITGEVGVGKTRLLASLIDEAASESGLSVVVLDLAPEARLGSEIIGASVKTYARKLHLVKYLRPDTLYAPRLQGRSREEVLDLAAKNALTIKPLLISITSNPPDALFIDDLTIYLQAGDIEPLTKLIGITRTFIATAYKGKRLLNDKGSGLSRVEKYRLDTLLNDPKLNILEVPLRSICQHRSKRAVKHTE
jgi:hypothetical protein